MMKYRLMLLTTVGLLLGCTPEHDLQGHDPLEYYKKHPVANKVETRYSSYLLHLGPGGYAPDAELTLLREQLSAISPMAVDGIEIQLHPSQMHNAGRKSYLRRLMTDMGFNSKHIYYIAAEDVRPRDVNIQLAYAAVVSPRCPDWRPSPVTSYSNMLFTPNIGCASATNLGLMVADPRDLVQGEGGGTPDTHNTTNAVRQYRSGASSSAPAAAAPSGASSGGQ